MTQTTPRQRRVRVFASHSYAYYFRYMKARETTIQLNDFHDLGNIVAAPYCIDFFTERTYAGILRNDIQGRVPPRPIETARRLNKLGELPDQHLENANASSGQTDANEPMLQHTRVWTVNDLREQVVAGQGPGS